MMFPLPPTPASPRRGWWRQAIDEYRAYGRFARIGIGMGLVFAAASFLCVSLDILGTGLVAYGVVVPATPEPTATATFPALTLAPTATALPTATPRPAPTATSQPTATPQGPQIVSGPYLGGTAAAFDAAYGQPTTSYGRSTYTWTTPDGIAIAICYCTTTTGLDGQLRTDTLSLGSTSAGWTHQLALSTFARLFPPHAIHVSDFIDPQIGPVHVYQSPDLAQTFPASAFKNSGNGSTLPPGTFSVACEDNTYGTCAMVVGE